MFYRQGSNWAMELNKVVFCLCFFFSRYIRDLLDFVAGLGVGCFIEDQFVDILAYAINQSINQSKHISIAPCRERIRGADNLVLLAPSWHALQLTLTLILATALQLLGQTATQRREC